jgi:hypothetical protein
MRLFLSLSNVARDVVTHVAFPMPDINYGAAAGENIATPTDDPESILGFKTTVNNRPVGALVERKAILDGKDVTEVLRALGVSLAPRLNQKSEISKKDPE